MSYESDVREYGPALASMAYECRRCDGSGLILLLSDKVIHCPACKGSGQAERFPPDLQALAEVSCEELNPRDF